MNPSKNIDKSKLQGSDNSTTASSHRQERAIACRKIVSLFPNAIPDSVYGNNYFLAASIILETAKHDCEITRRNRSTQSIRNLKKNVRG